MATQWMQRPIEFRLEPRRQSDSLVDTGIDSGIVLNRSCVS